MDKKTLYTMLLTNKGKKTITEVAKESGLDRTTIYSAMNRIKQLGGSVIMRSVKERMPEQDILDLIKKYK